MRKDEFRVNEVVRYELVHNFTRGNSCGGEHIGLFRSLADASKVGELLIMGTPGASLTIPMAKPSIGWISIEDDQPNQEVEALVCCLNECGGIYYEVAALFGENWMDTNGHLCNVTHWMPIPAEPAA